MPISTLGQLRDWLLSTPRTPLETLRETASTPEDLAAAISLLIGTSHLCWPAVGGSRMHFRRRKGPGALKVLDETIAGARQRNPFRDVHRLQPWINIVLREAAREWKKNPRHALGSLTESACRGEAFLASRLGRRATDREIAFFWDLVDGAQLAAAAAR